MACLLLVAACHAQRQHMAWQRRQVVRLVHTCSTDTIHQGPVGSWTVVCRDGMQLVGRLYLCQLLAGWAWLVLQPRVCPYSSSWLLEAVQLSAKGTLPAGSSGVAKDTCGCATVMVGSTQVPDGAPAVCMGVRCWQCCFPITHGATSSNAGAAAAHLSAWVLVVAPGLLELSRPCVLCRLLRVMCACFCSVLTAHTQPPSWWYELQDVPVFWGPMCVKGCPCVCVHAASPCLAAKGTYVHSSG